MRNIEFEKEFFVVWGFVVELESKLEVEKDSCESLICEGINRIEV